MKKSKLNEIAGVLVEAGRSDLAEEIVGGKAEVDELSLYIINTGELYRMYGRVASQKLQSGKEVDDSFFIKYATAGAKKYTQEFSAKGDNYTNIFSVSDIKKVAKELREYYSKP